MDGRQKHMKYMNNYYEQPVYFTSDTHFFHKSIIKYCANRTYESLENMHNAIIENWNKTVPDDANIFFLGDFCFDFKQNQSKILDIIDALHGKIHFISGNHDSYMKKMANRFVSFHNSTKKGVYIDVEDAEQEKGYSTAYLRHMFDPGWQNGWADVHLYGHAHGTPYRGDYALDIGIDNHSEFRPFCYNEIKNIFKNFENLD